MRAVVCDIQVVGCSSSSRTLPPTCSSFARQTTTFTAGQLANAFTLVDAFEVKAAHVGAARHLGVADLRDIQAARHFFHTVLLLSIASELIDGSQLNGFTQGDGAGIRLFLAGHHAEEGGFTRAVRTDDADDSAFSVPRSSDRQSERGRRKICADG